MNIKKQELTSASHSDFTLEALRQIAPSVFTEVRDEQGELTHKIDFDVLRELLGDKILDSDEERFGFYWVGKQDAKRAAAEPTRKTLRPILEDSVDWDNTQNLYIEGDNLEVLKLLQRAYLGKVKMIYIDPPYNTGNDFVYDDDFAMSREEMDEAMGNLDEEGNRLRRNLDSNPRYHSDWCSMIYSRLLVARTLLSNDGVIFISIDDNEVHHLRNICDEVFGASNFKSLSIVMNNRGGRDYGGIALQHDYILIYGKTDNASINHIVEKEKQFQFRDEEGGFNLMELRNRNVKFNDKNRPNLYYPFYVNPATADHNGLMEISLEPRAGFIEVYPAKSQGIQTVWRWGKEQKARLALNKEIFGKANQNGGYMIVQKYRKVTKMQRSIWDEKVFLNERGTEAVKDLLGAAVFDYPKSPYIITRILELGTSKDSLILDFFSGSATTAHAVMQLNAEDGGKRKYICVQLPEKTPEGSEARKAGYDTICEIGKKRIRRAGEDILGKLYTKREEILSNFDRFAIGEDVDKDPELWQYIEDEATREQAKQELKAINERIQNLDTGFRVLHVDTSNMEEVYFEPSALQQKLLFKQVNSVKKKRSDLDLLFGCMVDWGVELSYPLRQEEVAGKHLHIVNDGALVACFEKDIDLEVIHTIAKLEPLRVLFRESCFASDADKLNIYELFKQLCGWSAEESYRRIHVM